MISLDQALDRLLHRPRVLAEFLARGPAALEVSEEDAAALATIDRVELTRTATRICDEVLRRPQRGSGDLLACFPATIAAHRAQCPDDPDLVALAEALLDSPAFEQHRELPFAGAGRSIEETFYEFAEATGLGAADVREREFLAAMLRALAVNSDPDFLLPAAVQRVPAGFYAVTRRSGPTLYAALGGRLISGAITPFLAELLQSHEPAHEVARRHDVGAAALAAALAELATLGLV